MCTKAIDGICRAAIHAPLQLRAEEIVVLLRFLLRNCANDRGKRARKAHAQLPRHNINTLTLNIAQRLYTNTRLITFVYVHRSRRMR